MTKLSCHSQKPDRLLARVPQQESTLPLSSTIHSHEQLGQLQRQSRGHQRVQHNAKAGINHTTQERSAIALAQAHLMTKLKADTVQVPAAHDAAATNLLLQKDCIQ